MPTGRKYGKRRPASFSSIRFELLSSRRALSIVAENYFIIARSAGLECSPREGNCREKTRMGEWYGRERDCAQKNDHAVLAVPRFIDPAKKNHGITSKN